MTTNSRLWMVVWALSIAVACSSSSDEGGGGPAGAVGQQMSELGDLGAQFIEANQATYDTLGQATGLIGAAFAAGLPAPSIASKQESCLPDALAGQTFDVDVLSGTYEQTSARGGPNEVLFVLLSDPQTEEGYVSITCSGLPPNLTSVNIRVNTTGDDSNVEVLNLTASNISVFPPASFSAFLAGTLRSASGDDEIPIGAFPFEGNSSIFLEEFSRSTTTAFQVGATVNALVEQTTESSFENIRMVVAGPSTPDLDYVCQNELRFDGFMQGSPGEVSGGSIFCARPPLADGFNYFINCFEGSIDAMNVSAAEESCNFGFFGDPPTQVSNDVLADIQAGTDALLSMHNTVIAVAEAGAQIALQLAEAAQQQF